MIQKQLVANTKQSLLQTSKMSLKDEECEALITQAYRLLVEKKGRTFLEEKQVKENIRAITKWSLEKNYNPFLFLAGTVGNGKTTLAKACIQVTNLYWQKREDLLQVWRKPFKVVTATELNEIAKDDSKEFKEIKGAQRMMIDDIGTEAVSVKNYGNVISPFVETLYHRYDKGLITIMTSNLTLEEIRERYGVRVFDRMQESNKIFFRGESYRGNK